MMMMMMMMMTMMMMMMMMTMMMMMMMMIFSWTMEKTHTSHANQRNKMRIYRLFKTIDNYKGEDHLHQVTNTQHRIALTKLGLSNHKLAIETGRYSRPFKKPAERICPICKIEMEEEYHFLNICAAYQEKRYSLLDYLEKEYRIKISRMSPNKIFMFLINPPSGNVKIPKMIAKHIFQCFEERKGEDGKATLGINNFLVTCIFVVSNF